MKKSIIIALVCFFGLTQMNAQVSFKPGIRAGLNFSHFTKGDYGYYGSTYYYDGYGNYVQGGSNNNFSSKTGFNVGIYGALKLTKHYTLQPEIDYSNQGSYFREANGSKTKLDVSYLSLAVVNKFTFADKFNIHVGPTIDFVVDNNFNTDNDVDLSFVLGAGYNFTKNFGIEARVKKGIIPVVDINNYNGSSSHTNVVFQTGITYTFDVK